MLYYPQLASGGTSQYPIVRRETHRTVESAMPGGATIRSSDLGADNIQWTLTYAHLSDAEWGAIEALFLAAQGQLNPFTFLDPTDNLFVWSSDMTNAAWSKDPMLTVAAGSSDPMGGTGAFVITNGGQAAQGIGQTLAAPSGLSYVFCAYVASAAPTAVTLTAGDGVSETQATFTAIKTWTRIEMQSVLPSNQPTIAFRLELGPGGQASVFGPQVEAQPAPSLYKATDGRGGVYSLSRFAQDQVARITTGVNQNSATIQIFSTIPD